MTTQNDSGIWPPYEAFYIQAMLFNSRSAIASIERLSDALESLSEDTSYPLPVRESGEILNDLQNVVTHGAALSRYFWPVRRGHEARAELLRSAIGVSEDSPLKNRKLRNQIEHFDEELDTYFSDGIFGIFFPAYVGLLPIRDVPSHLFRAYYVDAGIFEMLGERYEIEPLANEIVRIHDRLAFCDANGGRLKPRKA
jgi:hypothetical protein